MNDLIKIIGRNLIVLGIVWGGVNILGYYHLTNMIRDEEALYGVKVAVTQAEQFKQQYDHGLTKNIYFGFVKAADDYLEDLVIKQ